MDEILVFEITSGQWKQLIKTTARPFWQVNLITDIDQQQTVDPLEAITSLKQASNGNLTGGVRMMAKGARFSAFKKGIVLTVHGAAAPEKMQVNVWQRGGKSTQQSIETPATFDESVFSVMFFAEPDGEGGESDE